MSIALIDRRSATRRRLSRWFQQGSADLRVVPASSGADLINVSGSVEDLQLIVFSVGGSSLKNPATFDQIVWLRQHMPCVPLVLLMDRKDTDGIVQAMAQGVRGFIATSMASLGTCVAAGGTFEPDQDPGQARPGPTERDRCARARETGCSYGRAQ
jgi:DNA-binding NarL/FixJ family response regulator